MWWSLLFAMLTSLLKWLIENGGKLTATDQQRIEKFMARAEQINARATAFGYLPRDPD